jgi:hypothetical protein
MDSRELLLGASRVCCEATNGLLVHSSPNMPALCAVRAVLREAAAGSSLLPIAVQAAKQQILFDTATGTMRPLEDSDIEYILTTDPAEVLEEFYQMFDVLSLQDAVADFPPALVANTAKTVVELMGGSDGGRLAQFVAAMVNEKGAEGQPLHPLNTEGLAMYREGLSPAVVQGYGLLTLSVLYDLVHGEFEKGTSLFDDRFSNDFRTIVETFDWKGLDEEGLIALLVQVYGMLVGGELTL